jgi:hypothetical protein
MLYSEIMAFCSEIHTKHINTLCGQNVEFLNVKHGGTYSNRWASNLKSYMHRKCRYSMLIVYSQLRQHLAAPVDATQLTC